MRCCAANIASRLWCQRRSNEYSLKKMLDAGCWMLEREPFILVSSIQHLASSIVLVFSTEEE
jgi:hypothetical protein